MVWLEFWAVEPDGFDQPLYVDGVIITEITPKNHLHQLGKLLEVYFF